MQDEIVIMIQNPEPIQSRTEADYEKKWKKLNFYNNKLPDHKI
jgi:hypothetical protein